MSASRFLYTVLSNAFKRSMPEAWGESDSALWLEMVFESAVAFKLDNANFNADKFFVACGIPDYSSLGITLSVSGFPTMETTEDEQVGGVPV